jgi:hypothetical protein
MDSYPLVRRKDEAAIVEYSRIVAILSHYDCLLGSVVAAAK